MNILRNGVKSAKGGVRAGSGRKTKAATEIKALLKIKVAEKEILRDGISEAEYAFSVLCAMVHSDFTPLDIRRQAAKDVLDRVLGKPDQQVKLSWKDEARKLGYDPNEVIARLASSLGARSSDGGSMATSENETSR